MRIVKTELNDLLGMLENSNARYIRLLDEYKNAVYPYNSQLKDYEARKAEIFEYLESNKSPNGRYYVEAKNVKASQASTLYEVEKTNGIEQTQKKAVETISEKPEKTEISAIEHYSIDHLINIKIENEKLKIENANLLSQIRDLEEIVEELEQVELKEAPQDQSKVNNLSFLKDIAKELLPVADEYFKGKKEEREIKLAELGMRKQEFDFLQEQKKEVPPLRVEPQNLTFEQIMSMKQSAPNEFYSWYSIPGNAEYFENLINQEQNEAS